MSEFATDRILRGNRGTYRVCCEIARGGMGAIYEAEAIETGQRVAIKEACLDPVACAPNRDRIRERLVQEMSVLAPLSHPAIPKIYDQFSSEINEYLVMEFIQGQTLMAIHQAVLAAGGLLEEARVLGWAVQVLDALAYLHEQPQPIIHRDIKPENLMLATDGRVMLIDFGLMKQVRDQLGASGPLIHAVGTVEYAPPEQYADGAGTDARSDIYSLGATLYYLLTGSLPPRAVERMLPGSLQVTRGVPPICKVNATVSRQMERAVLRALEIDPEHRWQSAREMREAIAPRRRFLPLPW